MKKIFAISALILLVSVGVQAQNKSDKKAEKQEQAQQEYTNIKNVIDSGTFLVVADWATSQGGHRQNISGESNQLKMSNSSATIYLPFFGTGTTANIGNKESGLDYSGPVENYKVKYKEKSHKIMIYFTVNTNAERCDYIITVFKGGTANIEVYSTIRSRMSYDGKLKIPS